MATSQSLASIMEQMVTKVMEDAVSTSIIYTQAQYDESAKEKVWFDKSMMCHIIDATMLLNYSWYPEGVHYRAFALRRRSR